MFVVSISIQNYGDLQTYESSVSIFQYTQLTLQINNYCIKTTALPQSVNKDVQRYMFTILIIMKCRLIPATTTIPSDSPYLALLNTSKLGTLTAFLYLAAKVMSKKTPEDLVPVVSALSWIMQQ